MGSAMSASREHSAGGTAVNRGSFCCPSAGPQGPGVGNTCGQEESGLLS